VALSLRISSLCALHWRRLTRLRTWRYVSPSRLLLALLRCRQTRLLLGALSLLRLRPLRWSLRPLFLLKLPLRPALLVGRLCVLLCLRSALLPLGAGLSFRLASLFALVLFVFLLAPLAKAGSDRPGKHKQAGCLDGSYESHGRLPPCPRHRSLWHESRQLG